MLYVSELKGKYLHHKGKYYDVLGEACDVSTNKIYIIYRQNYGKRCWWIRPKDMFFQKIIQSDDCKLRFVKIDDRTDIPDIKEREFFVRHTETGERYLAKYRQSYGKYLILLENKYEQLSFELSIITDFSQDNVCERNEDLFTYVIRS